MANELTVLASLDFSKGGFAVPFGTGLLRLDVSGTKYVKNVQNVGTSEEALDLGDVASPGMCLMVNRDTTNFVSVRAGSGLTDLIKIKAGEPALFRLAAATPYVIADTAAVNIEYVVVED